MILERVYMSESDKNVFLDIYVSDKIEGFVRDAILVIPGGGYNQVCSDREGEPIAQAFIPFVFNAFVLHYSVGRAKKYPAQLIEASWAIKYIRDNAEKFNINPDRVFATGFSAGGHLCATLGTQWDKKEIYDALDMEFGYNKPTGIMPIYPVILYDEVEGHYASYQNLWCSDNPSKEDMESSMPNLFVSENSSPAYIVHTASDDFVPVMSSIEFAKAYAKKGLEFELHIYPDGPHGMALANQITECNNPNHNDGARSKWVENAVIWTKKLK